MDDERMEAGDGRHRVDAPALLAHGESFCAEPVAQGLEKLEREPALGTFGLEALTFDLPTQFATDVLTGDTH